MWREMIFGRAITIVYPPMSLNIEAGRGERVHSSLMAS